MPDPFTDNEIRTRRRHARAARKKPHTVALLDPSLKGYAPRIRQWLLRMLVDCGALHAEHTEPQRTLKQLAELLKPPKTLESTAEIDAFITEQRSQISPKPAKVSGQFASNIKALKKTLGLSAVEADLLAFLTVYRQYQIFHNIVDSAISSVEPTRLTWQLCQIMGYERSEIESALHADSASVSSGLIKICRFDHHSRECIGSYLMPEKRVMQMLISDEFSLAGLLSAAVRPIEEAPLNMADYDFMANQRDLVHRLLKAAKAQGEAQPSILLDGPPGVGKSEFARMIAREAGFEAYEINEFDEDGDAATVDERLRYMLLAQKMMSSNKQHLLIMDEADALLGGSPSTIWARRGQNKASLLRVLDTLTVPTIWITNHAESLDPAVIRRLSLTIRFKTIPKQSLEKMLSNALPQCETLPQWTKALACNPKVTPARIAQASQAAKLMAQGDSDEELTLFKQVIAENLEIQSLDSMEAHRPLHRAYRPEVVNASENLDELTQSLKAHQNGRLCLYGPPGTGKTAYAHYLAAQCELNVAEYRASDLLSSWVGGTEQNIRAMFRDCNNDKTLLFLDEADSLFRSREHAVRNFEINQVNELLKGLEEYRGVFVASTNLMGELDPAVMRRIDFKIHLGFLKPDQAWLLFQDVADELGFTINDEEASYRALSQLSHLTPGDFATISRRSAISRQIDSPDALIAQLRREVAVKPEVKNQATIGFTAHIAA